LITPRESDSLRVAAVLLCLIGALLPACARKEESKVTDLPVKSAQAGAVALSPDVGKIEQVTVTTQGSGPTADVAVQEALKLAILEVNGEALDASSITVNFGLDVAAGKTVAMLRGSAFAEEIAQRSKGAVTSFKLVSMTEPGATGQAYKATIEASIAKFRPPADAKKIKIAISPLHVKLGTFEVGGQSVPASKVAQDIRQQLIDALTATRRFSVLDRDFTPEVQSELDLVASGQTPNAETAKLSQALSADIVWVGTINDFAYHRNASRLRTSYRELVSYSGGWSVSQRILNVSTRQIMLSDTLQDQVSPTAPTTMDRGIDGAQMIMSMESTVVEETVAAILARTFPIVVVAKDGMNVVLSQGGQAVKPGARYAVVSLGNELTDPQTHESLGRTESPCCEVVVDRVTTTLAYGHLDNAKVSMASANPGVLRVGNELRTVGAPVTAGGASGSQPQRTPPSAPRAAIAPAQYAPTVPTPADDTKKW
jgi:curli biogenesis system outer membrane secretion channel CsgG